MRLKRLFFGVMLLVGITGAGATNAAPEDISASISLKCRGMMPSNIRWPCRRCRMVCTAAGLRKSYRWTSSARWWTRMANSALPSHSRRWKMCISTTGNR